MDKCYTFSTLGTDNIKYYPLQFKWEDPQCPPCVGLLDFYWTKDIKFARTWPDISSVETIAIEFCNTEIIEVTENISKIYKVIKEMK